MHADNYTSSSLSFFDLVKLLWDWGEQADPTFVVYFSDKCLSNWLAQIKHLKKMHFVEMNSISLYNLSVLIRFYYHFVLACFAYSSALFLSVTKEPDCWNPLKRNFHFVQTNSCVFIRSLWQQMMCCVVSRIHHAWTEHNTPWPKHTYLIKHCEGRNSFLKVMVTELGF